MIKISKKIIAPFLSYSIFLTGLFFYAAPCTDSNASDKHDDWTDTSLWQ